MKAFIIILYFISETAKHFCLSKPQYIQYMMYWNRVCTCLYFSHSCLHVFDTNTKPESFVVIFLA